MCIFKENKTNNRQHDGFINMGSVYRALDQVLTDSYVLAQSQLVTHVVMMHRAQSAE